MLPFNSTKTVLCVLNELLALGDVTFNPIFESTLNNKYQVLPDTPPISFPTKIRYFGIGVKGYKILSDSNSTIPYKPDPRNMDLYYPIPFRCVLAVNDLSPLDREKYRMRVKRNINGKEYICYYLKKIEYLYSLVSLVKTDLSTGEDENVTLDFGYLNPVPTEVATPNESDDLFEYNSYIDATLNITGEEINEVVRNMFDNDYNYGKISEIGLYSGEDTQNTGDDGITYTESIYTQLICHECNIGTDLYTPGSVYEKILRVTQSTGFVL